VTKNCNHDIAGCEHAFKGRAVTFATTTILLLIHAYNCKNLKGSLLKMNVRGEGASSWDLARPEGRKKGKAWASHGEAMHVV